MSATDSTEVKHKNLIPFKPGQSGNPAGRPKGSRNKLAESFLADVLSEWEKHGADAISDMRNKNPGDFCKMVASLCPKEMTLNLNDNLSELSDDELIGQLRSLAALAATAVGQLNAGGEAQAGAAIPSQFH
jgi:hypothetical protein